MFVEDDRERHRPRRGPIFVEDDRERSRTPQASNVCRRRPRTPRPRRGSMFVEDDRERHRPRRGRMSDLTTQEATQHFGPPVRGGRRRVLQEFHHPG